MQQSYLIVSSIASANSVLTVLGRPVIDHVSATIDSFGGLPEGWAYGDGGPIPERTLQIARQWNDRLHLEGFQVSEAFPGDEEVLLAVSDGDHYFEVIIESDDTISVAYDYKRKQVFYRPHMTEERALRAIAEIKGRQWSASGYFIHADIMKKSTNLHDLLFATQATTELYLSSTGTAYKLPAGQLEITSGTTIESSQAWFGNRPFSGNLMQPRPFRLGTR